MRLQILKSLILGIVLILLIALSACSNNGQNEPPATTPQEEVPAPTSTPSEQLVDDSEPTGQNAVSGELVITFKYEKQSGAASNQFAIWIEDMDGNHVRTVYATKYTAKGGYKNRPDSIPVWVQKSGLSAMSNTEVDAISGATPKAGMLEYVWDLEDKDGKAVAVGSYKYFIEGTLRWKNQVLYSGMITIGDAPSASEAIAEYAFEGSGNRPALTESSAEVEMISLVEAKFR
jgi:hypothetical protein